MVRDCIVPECGKRRHGHGYCSAHYERWRRYGDPSAGRTVQGVPMTYFEETVLPYTGEDCLTWPHARALGYGYLYIDGRVRGVHRLVCERLYGSPPTPQHQAAHSCGKGHEGCVNPMHLSWKTRSENETDKISHQTSQHGERGSGARLTVAVIQEIRALRGLVSQSVLAKKFGVTQSHISRIQTGDVWGAHSRSS